MKWFSKKPKDLFFAHERLVLDAVRRALPSALQPIFKEQLDTVNLVQRHGDGREVNMYRMVGGRVVLPSTKLIQHEEEAVIATVALSAPSGGPKPVGKVWVVRGHLFQIMFNAKFERLKSCDGVVSVKLGPKFLQTEASADGFHLDLIPGSRVSDLAPPLSPERKSSALRLICDPMPADYLELLDRTDGFRYLEWKVLGLEDVYEVPGIPGASVIAELRECDAGDLALITRMGRMSVVRMDDLSETEVGELTFLDALRAFSRPEA